MPPDTPPSAPTTTTTRPWLAHYDPGVPANADYEALPLAALLERTAAARPDGTALVFMNARMTWRELKDDVDRLATAMAGLGVEPGTRVAIQLPNVPQTVIAYYAALTCGAQVVLTNPLYTAREVEHQWNDAECVLVVTADFLWAQTVSKARSTLRARHFVLASLPEYMRFPLSLLARLKLRFEDPPKVARVPDDPSVHAFKRLVRATRPSPPRPETSMDDVAVVQYTGGTTGVSKGAMLTHANLVTNVQQIDAWFPTLEAGGEVMLTCLPLFHVFGMTGCMNWSVAKGNAMVLVPNPRDTGSIVDAVEKHRVTIMPAVPAMYNAINHLPGIEHRDLSTLEICISGSAPIAADVLERFERLTGARILEGFGLTETSPVTHITPAKGARKVGWIGVPVSDTDARVVGVDDPERVMPTGEEGEIALRGPQVMKGYWRRPDETEQVLRDGWFLTGDLGVMDEDGYFKIVGRKKDMINCSGLKVFPDEVDEVLMAHEDVLEAATIGVPHEQRGETVKSFVVLRPGRSVSVEALQRHCEEQLAAYKVPREIEFLDELPKSSVLKVLRRELREREIAARAAR